MRLAIIGAGASGIISLKYGLDDGHECDVYEQTESIGGVWVYREEVIDKNGLPIASPMYKDLTTNLPKEAMTFLNFPYPEINKSFITHSQVLDYFRRFVNHFALERYIKFNSRVTQVSPTASNSWIITIQNVTTQNEESKEYDAVFICNGHYSVPNMPKIPGHETFKGTQVHSIYFRKPDEYKNKRILLIGNGPSGIDISSVISEVSQNVHITIGRLRFFEPSPRVIKKPRISHLKENEAVFVDGSVESIDVVIYCTGYKYAFPFLTKQCGIEIEDNWVRPLYKHIINIEHPTMFFIGIPQSLCIIPMVDLQARFALASLKQQFRLPTKQEMKTELDNDMDNKQKRLIPKKHAHYIAGPEKQIPYFEDLATTAGIKPVPPVVNKIFCLIKPTKDLSECFKIVDDENFIVTTV